MSTHKDKTINKEGGEDKRVREIRRENESKDFFLKQHERFFNKILFSISINNNFFLIEKMKVCAFKFY
jgi:hypothetical protein